MRIKIKADQIEYRYDKIIKSVLKLELNCSTITPANCNNCTMAD